MPYADFFKKFIPSLKSFTEAFNHVVAFFAVLAIIFGGVSWLFKPRIDEIVGPYASIPKKLEEIDSVLDGQGRKIASLERDLQTILPSKNVYEYVSSSRVSRECKVGLPCNAIFIMKASEEGLKCKPTSLTAYVVNHYGIKRPARLLENDTPLNADTSLIEIRMSFIVPEGTKAGISHFYVTRQFENCKLSGSDSHLENSPLLEFEILAE